MSFKEVRAPRYTIDNRELFPSPAETPPFTFMPNPQIFNDKYKPICDIPGLPDYYLRWTSDRWGRGLGDMIYDIKERVSVTEEHHRKIAFFGIKIPAYKHVAIGKAPERSEATALYTVVEKLDITPWQDLEIEQATDVIERRIVMPMRCYYSWLDETQQPYQLEDLGIFTQFGLVSNPEAEDGYDAYLLDIECLVARRK